MEEQLRLHRCCFTGHRPEKLTRSEEYIKNELRKEILSAIDFGCTTFISGMARGTDIWAAEIIIDLRNSGMPIKLICASPFEGFEHSWEDTWKLRYKDVLAKADLVRYICKHYSRSCFQIRNQWMVDHATRVIAVYNGSAGGTRNTIRYANAENIDVVTIQA